MTEFLFNPFIYGSLQWFTEADESSLTLFFEGEEVDTLTLKGQGQKIVGYYAFDRVVFHTPTTQVKALATEKPFGIAHLNKAFYPVAKLLFLESSLFSQHKEEVAKHLIFLFKQESKELEPLAFLILCLQEYLPYNPSFITENQEKLQQTFWDLCLIFPQKAEEQALMFWALQAFIALFDHLKHPLQLEARQLYYKKESLLCYPQTALGCAYLVLAKADTDHYAKGFLLNNPPQETKVEDQTIIDLAKERLVAS